MDLSVSVRRTVVQDKFFMARMQFLFLFIDFVFFPVFQNSGSRSGKPARIGNSVSGKLRVLL